MLRPTFANNQTDMDQISTVILSSGRSAVELALFILLPIMIVMLSLMRWMESVGWLTQVVRFATPALRPFGLNGLGVFAVTQVLFVSFAAPMATLAIMAKNGCSPRHIAATLAIILALAQGNVTFPMSAVGLDIGSRTPAEIDSSISVERSEARPGAAEGRSVSRSNASNPEW
ncbi:MAG: nucleoside recognition domain-containing protein, partial [Oceanobacter sp.]